MPLSRREGACQGLPSEASEVSAHTSQNGRNKKSPKQMLVRMWRNGTTQALLVGVENGPASLDNSLAFYLKTKHTTELPQTLPCIPGPLPWRSEDLHSHKILNTNVHSSIVIRHGQKWEVTQMTLRGDCHPNCGPSILHRGRQLAGKRNGC